MSMGDLNEQSPLRLLEQATGGLGQGQLGVVLARAGVGKTACLVQFGLDALMREGRVLHLHFGDLPIERIKLWYDTLYQELATTLGLDHEDAIRARVESRRIIHVFKEPQVSVAALQQAIDLYTRHLDFRPTAIVADGFDFNGDLIETAAVVGALKANAGRFGAPLWMSAQTHREAPLARATNVLPPVDRYDALIDIALHLEPSDRAIAMQILKAPNIDMPLDTEVKLQPSTLRLIQSTDPGDVPSLPPRLVTLLSGAATGAEAAFGECAENWGLGELNFTFEGKPVSRTRGLVMLDAGQLQRGSFRARLLKDKIARDYPNTPLFNKVLQSIYHQVDSSTEVFSIGLIQDNGTVKGGTGWAVELAKDQNKAVHVFDQEKGTWFTWAKDGWTEEKPPRITARRFTGTGSRHLSDRGRQAIVQLFERSFAKKG